MSPSPAPNTAARCSTDLEHQEAGSAGREELGDIMHQLEVPLPMLHGWSRTSVTALSCSRTAATTTTALYPPKRRQGQGLGHGEAVAARGPFNEAAQHQAKSPSTVHDMPPCGLPVRHPSHAPPCSWHPFSFLHGGIAGQYHQQPTLSVAR